MHSTINNLRGMPSLADCPIHTYMRVTPLNTGGTFPCKDAYDWAVTNSVFNKVINSQDIMLILFCQLHDSKPFLYLLPKVSWADKWKCQREMGLNILK